MNQQETEAVKMIDSVVSQVSLQRTQHHALEGALKIVINGLHEKSELQRQIDQQVQEPKVESVKSGDS